MVRRFELVRVNERVLGLAGALSFRPRYPLSRRHPPRDLSSLLGPSLEAVVTYDERMAEAARSLGWKVVAPRA